MVGVGICSELATEIVRTGREALLLAHFECHLRGFTTAVKHQSLTSSLTLILDI